MGLSPCRAYQQTPDPHNEASHELAERAEIDVEILIFQTEDLFQFFHAPFQKHEGLAEALDLVIGKRSVFHPPHGLPLHQLSEQIDQRQNELSEPALDVFRIG